jgi:ATP-dependent helicase Lhr and Lhr-like helicase
MPAPASHNLPDAIDQWFTHQAWQAFEFQREVWAHMAAGRSGVLHATTGSGKTYAVWFGAIARALQTPRESPGKPDLKHAAPLRVLWITPMRALASDTALALAAPLAALQLNWSVGQRTGDTAATERARQGRRMPARALPKSSARLMW